jgi:tetratricopeptide (TPR) repeat protein
VIELLLMRKTLVLILIGGLLVLILAAALTTQVPSLQSRLSWRADMALTYVRAVLNPAGEMPTSLPQPHVAITRQPTSTPTPQLATQEPTHVETVKSTPTPTPSPTPIPDAISLDPPTWEKQDANNCGPTSLALYLRHYGWEGDQFTISKEIKPFREDRNVNVEELAYYVRTRVGWLNFEYRVGGDLETLKRILAAGIPVMIEEGEKLDQSYWPNDDQWAAHYLLLTAYDDASETFTGQDTYFGANKKTTYSVLDDNWQAFNRVYIMVYPPEQEDTIKSILGPQWDVDYNRQYALQVAQTETEEDPKNPFTWFNLGTNLAYFERYIDATNAYDQARTLGLPQRMLRYQFGPFMAYFHSGQLNELSTLLDYALKITRNSEEAFLWRGWMHYRQDEKALAIEDFHRALDANPNYQDALYALRFVGAIP